MKSLDELWKRIVEFNDRYFPNWRETELVYLSNAIAGETGELCNLVKHFVGGGTRAYEEPITNIDFFEELFDIFVYSVLFSEGINIDKEDFCKYAEDRMKELERRMKRKNEVE